MTSSFLYLTNQELLGPTHWETLGLLIRAILCHSPKNIYSNHLMREQQTID
jgi:hypothetical protein